MKYYRIKSILHSGRKGERNTPRTDGRYPLRIGRIIELNANINNGDIVVGLPLVIKYVQDENGNDYRGFCLHTSKVVDWDYVFDNVIRIETCNSIYELERVDEHEVDIDG